MRMMLQVVVIAAVSGAVAIAGFMMGFWVLGPVTESDISGVFHVLLIAEIVGIVPATGVVGVAITVAVMVEIRKGRMSPIVPLLTGLVVGALAGPMIGFGFFRNVDLRWAVPGVAAGLGAAITFCVLVRFRPLDPLASMENLGRRQGPDPRHEDAALGVQQRESE